MPTLQRDGLTLSYLDEGQGPPVLLLHGFPMGAESFRPQLAALSGSFRFIVPNHRGFGGSEVGPGPLEMSTIAADALAILDALALGPVIVGGLSMGGYAAMALVRLDPARVRGLVLIDTQVTADDAAAKARREEVARQAESGGVAPIADAMVPRLLAPGAPEAVRQALREHILRVATPAGIAAASRGMALRGPSKEILSRYSGPALVVVGEEDGITPPEKAKQMAELIAGAQLVSIPGAGHLPNWEKPERFNEVMRSFVLREL